MDEGPVYLDAARAVADAVGRIGDSGWEQPGLGVWTVRDLVGHTSRSLVTVLTYVEQPASGVELPSAEAYVARLREPGAGGDADAVAERGRTAGRALGPDPAAEFAALVDRVSSRLATAPADQVIPTIFGGMRLGDYLPTRTFELVVHAGDIARATGVPVRLPVGAVASAAALAGRVAALTGQGEVVLAALTGRAPLPPGFSLV